MPGGAFPRRAGGFRGTREAEGRSPVPSGGKSKRQASSPDARVSRNTGTISVGLRIRLRNQGWSRGRTWAGQQWGLIWLLKEPCSLWGCMVATGTGAGS